MAVGRRAAGRADLRGAMRLVDRGVGLAAFLGKIPGDDVLFFHRWHSPEPAHLDPFEIARINRGAGFEHTERAGGEF